ncbi:MAG: diacylglycerol kinase family protein [Defluviitaleaceae bacterium]|nr:diacylglycerol kinase family protein [Defluviitaleaceae bacterium]
MKNRRLLRSFRDAWRGIRKTAATERNFKIHIAAGIAVVIICMLLKLELSLFVWVIFAVFAVLGAELFNTAVEALTDLVCESKPHPLAKKAKDAAAGAVLVASLQAVAVALTLAFVLIGRRAGN